MHYSVHTETQLWVQRLCCLRPFELLCFTLSFNLPDICSLMCFPHFTLKSEDLVSSLGPIEGTNSCMHPAKWHHTKLRNIFFKWPPLVSLILEQFYLAQGFATIYNNTFWRSRTYKFACNWEFSVYVFVRNKKKQTIDWVFYSSTTCSDMNNKNNRPLLQQQSNLTLINYINLYLHYVQFWINVAAVLMSSVLLLLSAWCIFFHIFEWIFYIAILCCQSSYIGTVQKKLCTLWHILIESICLLSSWIAGKNLCCSFTLKDTFDYLHKCAQRHKARLIWTP